MRRQVVWTVNSMTYVQVCEAVDIDRLVASAARE
jgi:hypothetical protein